MAALVEAGRVVATDRPSIRRRGTHPVLPSIERGLSFPPPHQTFDLTPSGPDPTPELGGYSVVLLARAQFIKRFKEVQRLQTELGQYTDLTDEQREQIEQALPKDDHRAFRGAYLETAQRLKEQQGTPGGDGEPANLEVDQIDFEFVLFASAVIDYDYIMKLIAKYSGQDPKKLTISREQLIGLIQSDVKFLDEREEITEYVRSLTEGEGLDEAAIRAGYEQFKAEKQAREIEGLAQAHGLTTESLSAFVDTILQRMIFDGEQLTDLMEPLGLGWRERRERELALMADLVPLLNKRAHGRDISGLNAYEHGTAR